MCLKMCYTFSVDHHANCEPESSHGGVAYGVVDDCGGVPAVSVTATVVLVAPLWAVVELVPSVDVALDGSGLDDDDDDNDDDDDDGGGAGEDDGDGDGEPVTTDGAAGVVASTVVTGIQSQFPHTDCAHASGSVCRAQSGEDSPVAGTHDPPSAPTATAAATIAANITNGRSPPMPTGAEA